MEVGLKVFDFSGDIGDLPSNLVVETDADEHLRYDFDGEDDSVHRLVREWVLNVHIDEACQLGDSLGAREGDFLRAWNRLHFYLDLGEVAKGLGKASNVVVEGVPVHGLGEIVPLKVE